MDTTIPFIGTISIFGGAYAPEGWLLCDGRQYAIVEYQALFMVIGYQFGGNNNNMFCVPDLRGRIAIGATSTPVPASNISARPFASQGGTETVTLEYAQMPPHSHLVSALPEAGIATSPVGNFMAFSGGLDRDFSNAAPNSTFNKHIISSTGGNLPHDNIQPSLALNFIIAANGVFPTKS